MAFKKPLSNLKTSAPLRNSDLRKLRQRIARSFSLRPEDSELLVPNGLLSIKFSTHLDEAGVAYLASDGDPLWFTVGKGSDVLIPTVYTLQKYPILLPCLSTPSAVIPILMGGADLMIPGVISHPDDLRTGQLVSICRHLPSLPEEAVAAPLAVGSMAVDSSAVTGDAKGKAVHVVHTIGDKLWELGSKMESPEWIILPKVSSEDGPSEETIAGDTDHDLVDDLQDLLIQSEEPNMKANDAETSLAEASGTDTNAPVQSSLKPEEVSSILRSSLLQAMHSTLSKAPTSTFPIPSTTFYTSYILPCRPAHLPSNSETPIDIKHSTHKSLTAFLRAAEKEGLIKLKDSRSKADSSGPSVIGVSATHKDVLAHVSYVTLAELEAKRLKKEEREAKENTQSNSIVITELWKPHQQSSILFEEKKKDTTALYTHSELKHILNDYITEHTLAKANSRQLISVDELLHSVISSKKSDESGKSIENLKREDVLSMLIDKMQAWHRIEVGGQDPILKKGQLKPVSIVVKIRQGRKACTLVTNFEPYLLAAEVLAEELRRLCASSTSVTPLPGKNAGLEVMVQGKQIKAVVDHLISKGVPKKWIESVDLSDKKK